MLRFNQPCNRTNQDSKHDNEVSVGNMRKKVQRQLQENENVRLPTYGINNFG